MANRLFEIRVNSSETNKDLGFEVLEMSGLSLICLEDEKYIVAEEGIDILRKNKVIYEIIAINGEVIKNATKVEGWIIYSHTL